MDANEDGPSYLPPPREMAELLMARAWDCDTPDRERLLLEQGALTITGLLVQVAAATEHGEARRTSNRRRGAVGGLDDAEER